MVLGIVAVGPALDADAVSVASGLDWSVGSLARVLDGFLVFDVTSVVLEAVSGSDRATVEDVGAMVLADVVTVELVAELIETARTTAIEPIDAGVSAVVACM